VHCSKTASLIAISPFPCALNAHLELLRYPPPRPHASPPALRDGVLFYGALQITFPALSLRAGRLLFLFEFGQLLYDPLVVVWREA